MGAEGWSMPYRDALPPLTTQEREALRRSIERDGLREPCIATEDGRILDGHNRLEFRPDAPVERLPGSAGWSDGQCLALVYRFNLERRNLSPDQKTEARRRQRAAAAELYAAGGWTQEQLAELFGVDQATVSRWLITDMQEHRGYKSSVKIPVAHHETVLARLEAGEPQRQVAADYGVSQPAVSKLAARLAKANEGLPPRPLITCDVGDLWEVVRQGLKVGTVYADPPWSYGNAATRAAADDHYPTMSLEDIFALPVAQLADTPSHLHLWVTANFLKEGIALLEHWGFAYKTLFTWCKPQIGMGNYYRMANEFLLLGVKGDLVFPDKTIRSWAEWERGRHSAKPDDVRDMVARVSPPPRLELFARCSRQDWMTWGNQVGKDLFTQDVRRMFDGRDAGRQGQPDGREVPDDRPGHAPEVGLPSGDPPAAGRAGERDG